MTVTELIDQLASLEKPPLTTGVVSADLATEVEKALDTGRVIPQRVRLLCHHYRQAMTMIAELEHAVRLAKNIESRLHRKYARDMRELRELAKLEDQRD